MVKELYTKIIEYYIKNNKTCNFDKIVLDNMDIDSSWSVERILATDIARYKKGLPLYGAGEVELPNYVEDTLSIDYKHKLRREEAVCKCSICKAHETHFRYGNHYICSDTCLKLKKNNLNLNILNMYGNAMYLGVVEFRPLTESEKHRAVENDGMLLYTTLGRGNKAEYICDCDELRNNAYLFYSGGSKYTIIDSLEELDYFKNLVDPDKKEEVH